MAHDGDAPSGPGKALPGCASFAWHEGGAFLVMRTQVDEPQFPDGLAMIGSDDAAGAFAMIYCDERGVSRHYVVTAGERTVTWRRDHPTFSQMMTITAGEDGTLVGQGRMSRDGGAWEDDLSQVYKRDAPTDRLDRRLRR